ncbi:MAG: RNA 3'-terminal phosphate cyclase [Burkholderiaceae bacterium]|jgi:RNA 3'-terminal phosphate cyclase (ATP)|nr:RNA 3'-terminal phosphate cyclase [Burkholderiaceae bacterium]
MIEIDGAAGEGGGQILRSALALSMCTGQPFAMLRIRAGRARPGLMRQHLACVHAAAAICGAQVQGAELNSQALHFTPGPVRAGEYRFVIASAGSCTLLLQTLWPALMLADGESRLALVGGTHNPAAPPFHFLERSYAPLLRRLGAPCELQLRRLGFYPAGGGEISAVLGPAGDRLQPFDLEERGALVANRAECFAPGLPRSVAQRELDRLGQALGWAGEQLQVAAVRQNEGPGNALLVTLDHEHLSEVFTQFGRKGISAENVAHDLACEVRRYQARQAALGAHLADQWALPLALAVWRSGHGASYTCTELTPHAHSNFAVIAQFLPVRFSTAAAGDGWRVSLAPA